MARAAEGDEGGVHGAHGPPELHSSPREQDEGACGGIGSPRCLQAFLWFLEEEEEVEEEASPSSFLRSSWWPRTSSTTAVACSWLVFLVCCRSPRHLRHHGRFGPDCQLRGETSRSSSFFTVACARLVLLVGYAVPFCGCGPRCSASWPVWTRRILMEMVGFAGDSCTSRCISFPVVRPKMVGIMAGMDQRDSYLARVWQWHVQCLFCWFFTPRAVFLPLFSSP